MNERVSILVPVYRIEETLLRRCLESIRSQTYSNLEILLVNDGSPDDCGAICDEYAKKDSRVRVFHIPNGGVSRARNYALERTTGNYILFVDGDDSIAPSCIEVLVKQMQIHNADCVLCAARHVKARNLTDVFAASSDIALKTISLNQREAIDALCYMKQPFAGYEFGAAWGCLYRRAAIENLRFSERMTIGEDFVFKYQAFLCTDKLICVNLPLYYYVIREHSAMRSGYDARMLVSIAELETFLSSQICGPLYVAGLQSRVTNIALAVLFRIPMDKAHRKERDCVKRFIIRHRAAVIRNPKTCKKVRLALLLSYFGFDFVQRMYRLSHG